MPANIRSSSIHEVQAHERATKANACLGGYGMVTHCPLADIVCMHITLTQSDLSRLFVLQDFAKCTRDQSCQLIDVVPASAILAAMEHQPKNAVNELDLTVAKGMELVLCGTAVDDGPLIAIDGNHRLLAHYIRSGSIEGVPAYIGIHPKMYDWHMVPARARQIGTKNPIYRSEGLADR